MDDRQRIALVETRTLDNVGDDQAPRQLIRYQFGNHLGSASLELDEQAQIISCEEYAPYGSSTYQAVRNRTETPKRYQFTGKERDEESGLYYHGARFYAAWLGRWTSSDLAGLLDGPNTYVYCRTRPVTLLDPDGTDSITFTEEDIQAHPEAHVIVGQPPNTTASSSTSSPAAEEASLLDQAADYIRQSDTAQFLLGLGMGGLGGAAPGGFVVGIGGELSGVSEDLPAPLRMGYGLGETAWGIAQIITGGFGEIGGGVLTGAGAAASATGVGAAPGVPAMAGGVGLIGVSTAAIVEGAADVGTGWGVFMSAWDDLPEGTHSITDNPNVDRTRSATPAEALEASLEREGMPRPAGHEPHHIAAASDPRAARAVEILEEAGIGVNDAPNGVWLPRTSAASRTGSVIQAEAATSHDAVHTARYFSELTERLERAREAGRVLEELEFIRLELQLGMFPW